MPEQYKEERFETKFLAELQEYYNAFMFSVINEIFVGAGVALGVPEQAAYKMIATDPNKLEKANFFMTIFNKFKNIFKKKDEPPKFRTTLKRYGDGRAMTPKQWRVFDKAIDDYWKRHAESMTENIAVKTYLLGREAARFKKKKKPYQNKSLYQVVTDQFNGSMPDTIAQAYKDYNFKTAEKTALNNAFANTAIHVTKANAEIKEAIRSQVNKGIQDGKSSTEIVSDMYWNIQKDEELLNKYSANYLRRNWHRVACFPKGTKIMTTNGAPKIESLKIGRNVITHKGQKKKITKIFHNKYTGRMFKLKTKSGIILHATEDHPIYVYRNGYYEWIPIKDLKKGDKLLRVKESGGMFGVKHSKEYKEKMKGYAIKNNYAARITTKEARNKRNNTMIKMYKEGDLKAWNKGKNKDNNKFIKKASNKIKNGFKSGRQVWNKGLTAEKDERVKKGIEKIKGRKTSKEQTEKWKKTYAKNFSKYHKSYTTGKSGFIENIFTGKKEFYRSSYEKKFLEYCNKNNIEWTSKHKISIDYIDKDGKGHIYIPDFVVIIENKRYLIEVKSNWQIVCNYKNIYEKIESAKIFCKNNSMLFLLITEEWFKSMGISL